MKRYNRSLDYKVVLASSVSTRLSPRTDPSVLFLFDTRGLKEPHFCVFFARRTISIEGQTASSYYN
jgi:hypothetical protein